jgi:hypothetical protein
MDRSNIARRPFRPVPPLQTNPDSLEAALEALRSGKRIDTVNFIERQKYAYLELLLNEVQHLDFMCQAFFLGISETCLRKWRTALRSTKKLRKVDSAMASK